MYISWFKFLAKKLHFRFTRRCKIVSRTACLGNDVIDSVFRAGGRKYIRHNFQKSRVDYLVDYTFHRKRIRYDKIILRKDIINIVENQRYNFFSFKSPDFIIIDTYSELTDQEFRIEGCPLYCNYSDIDIDSKVVSKGLMDLEGLEDKYIKFFDTIRTMYPSSSIIFIEFPFNLDPREKFIQRGLKIRSALKYLEKSRQVNIIRCDDHEVEQSNKDSFYYHFSKKTIGIFEKKLREVVNHEL